MKRERLFIKRTFAGEVFLADVRNNLIGWFPSVEAAQKWCEENGYKWRVA